MSVDRLVQSAGRASFIGRYWATGFRPKANMQKRKRRKNAAAVHARCLLLGRRCATTGAEAG
eukprot:779968-Rhodomonas_salina.2